MSMRSVAVRNLSSPFEKPLLSLLLWLTLPLLAAFLFGEQVENTYK